MAAYNIRGTKIFKALNPFNWWPFSSIFSFLKRFLPKSLFYRSLIIVIAPMILLQSVLTFVFLERHWQLVTKRLSEAVARDIGAIVELLQIHPDADIQNSILRIAEQKLSFKVSFLENTKLPVPAIKENFSLLDRTLAEKIGQAVQVPFWIDTVGNSNRIEIRIKLGERILSIFAQRSQAYATNSHIFIVWMVGTALVLMMISLIFLRNQIRPIQRLGKAAERFGRGYSIKNLAPEGAREVRQAAQALIEMGSRIEKQIDQRTTMLAGVSHDLRTVLTRFRLQLAMLEESPDKEELSKDVSEMEKMLADYLAFASGASQEGSDKINLPVLLAEICNEAKRSGHECSHSHQGDPFIEARPGAFKRCLGNLVTNACRYGQDVSITSKHDIGKLIIDVEDNGPGIPEQSYEDVFKPFFRLDEARNQNQGGSGLGLSIARDIALVHGGQIILSKSQNLGGLKATLELPL